MFVLELKITKCIILTFKSLKGCIKIPKGNLDFCNSEFVSGMRLTVHLNIL